MKLLGIIGGALATIGGITILPILTLSIGALAIAVIITMFLCKSIDREYVLAEKTLYALLGNVCLSVLLTTIVPTALGIKLGGEVLLFMSAGSFIGTFIGAGIASLYEPEQPKER